MHFFKPIVFIFKILYAQFYKEYLIKHKKLLTNGTFLMSLFKSVATFGGFTLLSRITGFIRDMVLAKFLGAGMIADTFFVAFKLPNLFRSLFAEGAFTSAFVPILSQKMVSEGEDSASVFASRAISVLSIVLVIFVFVVEVFMDDLVRLMAPGFINDPEKIALATELSRITFPFLLFVSIVSFQSGILNAHNKFAAPAAAPIILNLMMTGAVFVSVPFWDSPVLNLSWSVCLAGLVEIAWLWWFLRRLGIRLHLDFKLFQLLKNADIRTLFRRIGPGVLGAGVYQINMMIDTILVSFVGTGAISWLYYANRLQQLPLGVIGAAISVALLPVLSKSIKSGALSEANRTQNRAVEYGALFSIPSAVALIVLSAPLVNILFERGRFGSYETEMTALAVIAYSFGLPVYVLAKALTPNFFARGDTKTPVKYSIVALISNVVFALLLIKPLGHVGVAASTAIAAVISAGQYIYGLKKRGYWSFERSLVIKLLKITFSSLVMGIVLYFSLQGADHIFSGWLQSSFWSKVGILGLICILGVASFGIMAKLTGVLDISELQRLLPAKGKKHDKKSGA